MKQALSKGALHGALFAAAGASALLASPQVLAQALNFAQSPLFLGTTVKPNVLVVYDNSQSMDGTMAGRVIAGDDPATRGNIARTVLRDTITAYRSAFNWGLASFALSNTTVYTTYAYYFGGNDEVRFTNDCIAGVSLTNNGLRCVANPQPDNDFNFITYRFSGDDPAINDVLYAGNFGNQLYGIGVNNSTSYRVYANHLVGAGWTAGDFNGWPNGNVWTFTPTDAGFTPATPPNSRMFWLRRAWGYYGSITGAGVINDPVEPDSAAHHAAMMALLATETNNNATAELKNGAVFTPLAGALGTARDYFANTVAGRPSPISQSCQKNFVLLATDGNPTGRTDGSMYTAAELTNTFNAGSGTWTFGTAATNVFNRVSALRTTPMGGTNYDVQSYVIGLGDSVANASSVATLNRMAELGGTSTAYLASDAAALADAFRKISIDIIARTAAASSVSLNSGSLSSDTMVFQGRFSSADWAGQLLAFPVGSTGEPAAKSKWDAGQQLNAQNWNTGRQILTYKPSAALGSRGVPFRWPANAAAPGAGEIDAGLVAALNRNGSGTVDDFGAQRLEFLRGNTAREQRNCAGCPAPVFRNRAVSVLGDIVNSAPAYVGGPTGEYRDTMESTRYTTFSAGRNGQPPTIYVGANDGMLHAFNAANGNELFAYVPWAVRNRLSALTTNPYVHLFTVDGSPSVGDVHVGGGWKTMLVAGMNAGAPGLYALDITNPGDFTEAMAAKVVRWEIGSDDGDVGHIFGRPILTKMRDGRWRAIVGNGYNSTNGRAVLLLVDLETGAITRIDTKAGGTTTPNGLSAVVVVSTNDNGVADAVYAGDLAGNLWKFDVSDANPAAWKVAHGTSAAPKALFTAASGQAITARPDVTRHPKGGYMVTVGSGRYVDIGDNAAGSTQAMYGIWDNGAEVAMSDLQVQSVVRASTADNKKTYRLSTHAVGTPADALQVGDAAITLASYQSTKKGWRMDLPSSGERVVTEALVRNGRLVISTLIPSTAACSYGGDGWIMEVQVFTGNRAAALDLNDDNLVN
ncbi:MAG: PilC/PilY family type IV pilus protein, partial [Aquabacterium sp.]|nr:PilC/PilY family type IV pilus protein [Aquabacterium sp.]